MDENEYFRQAALRICSNLEIEEAMFSCLQFVRQMTPAERAGERFQGKLLFRLMIQIALC